MEKTLDLSCLQGKDSFFKAYAYRPFVLSSLTSVCIKTSLMYIFPFTWGVIKQR